VKSLATHLQGVLASDLTLATCWMFIRLDGQRIGVTNHVEDIVEGGETYYADSGFTRTNVQQNMGLSVDNHDVGGFFDNGVFNETDLRAKKYDGAIVESFMVDYLNPDEGRIWVSTWILGQGRIVEGRYEIEFRSLLQLLEMPIADFFGPSCRHKLGGPDPHPVTGRPGCGVDLSLMMETGTITAVSNPRRIFSDAARTEGNDWWAGGEITMTSGANIGVVRIIKRSFSTGQFELMEPMPFGVEINDLFSVTPGCNHLFRMSADPEEGPYTGDCILKYNNKDNFGAEPESLSAVLQFGGLK